MNTTRSSRRPAAPSNAGRRSASPVRARKKKSGGALFAFGFLFAAAVATASFFAPSPGLIDRLGIQPPTPLHPRPMAASVQAEPLASLPDGGADLLNPQTPVSVIEKETAGIPFTLIAGGVPGTRRYLGRQGVEEFVKDAGAVAGLNGTFFANASLHGTDNLLIGPSLCGNEAQAVVGPYDRKPALVGRPLVLISATHTRIVPYDPVKMDEDREIRALLPGVTDAFLGGVWLVHSGHAVTKAQMARFHVTDANDPRRRAFFAVLADGRPALGATTDVASSSHLARALAQEGVQEAVLLDSGFSTSLVYRKKILVTGHTAPGIPSRPVPHAVVLFDTARMAKRVTQAAG